jgi:hypothetical protein
VACGAISGTLTLHKPPALIAADGGGSEFSGPVDFCETYTTQGTNDRIYVGFCNSKYDSTEDVCVTLLLASSGGTTQLTTFEWPFADGQSLAAFFTGNETDGTATLEVLDDTSQTINYRSLSGGLISVANATWAVHLGDIGSANISGTSVPLENGASVDFNVQVGFSVSADVSSSGSGGSGAGGSSSSGGNSGGTCDSSMCAMVIASCEPDSLSQAPCYCASACADQAALNNPSACCNADPQQCISELESDCQMNQQSASSLGTTCGYPCTGQ